MNLYLTRLVLTPRAFHRTDDPGLHKLVMACFASYQAENARAQAGILHVINTDRAHRQAQMLVQSGIEPELGTLPAGVEHAETKRIDPYLDAVSNGDLLRFSLTAAPLKALKTNEAGEPHRSASGRERGKRVALIDEAERLAWLSRQLQEAATVRHAQLHELPSLYRRGKALYTPVRFTGMLRIDDAAFLRERLVAGIGRGRAYGLGLLLLAAGEPSS